MTDSAEKRLPRALLASASLLVFLVLLFLVRAEWQPLLDLDTDLGTDPWQLTRDTPWLRHLAVGVEHAFDWIPMTVLTVLTGILLALKGHVRAAIYAVGVMTLTAVVNRLVKLAIARERPQWDDPMSFLTSYSFPSGHSSAIAAAAVVITVLAGMFVRRRGLRRLATAGAVLLALVVGADRVFIGAHNVSDVIAGWALGIAVALGTLLFFDPTPKPLALKAVPMPEAIPTPERTLGVVLNPIKVENNASFRAMVEGLATTSGFDKVMWWETTVEDTGYAMAHDAATAGVNLVLAVGGDGTIRAVCEELAGTGIPVGIVPAGTGNLLARNLDIPLYLRNAVDVGLNGQDRAIDMVTIDGDNMDEAVFLVMAGMGFDAAIMEGVNETFKAKVGWLAYVWSALKSLL
ncbi:MAG: phosphatase PAP2 family protein, partial [Myxococcales bacterium]